MAQSQGRVVAELLKVWESAVAKGKMLSKDNSVRSWLNEVPSKEVLQNAIGEQMHKINSRLSKDISKLPSSDIVVEKTKVKLGRVMTNYEEFIGISEVKSAHARVLQAEAKFIECQEQRRLASKELMDSQNQLIEIRAELDKTPRGDERYLELIKREFAVMKDERVFRARFDNLEKMEREVFAELSSALRFSHEKERAQNEKTKYWSIVGSIIGAGLGILGATINNRIKRNQMKQILGETATQVAAIQQTVENLTNKVNEGALTASTVSQMVTSLKEHEDDLTMQREKLSESIRESVKVLQQLFTAMSAFHHEQFPKILQETASPEMNQDFDLTSRIIENRWHVTAVICCLFSALAYKYM